MSQAITEMVRQLRGGQSQNGLILANGGILTYQHAICLSSHPPSNGMVYPNVQAAHQVTVDVSIPRVTYVAEGDAVIEVSGSTGIVCLLLGSSLNDSQPLDQSPRY